MDAVLNYQNPTMGGPDLMVIDGIFQQFSKTDEQVDAFNKLNTINAKPLEIPFFLGKSSATENFYMYKDKRNGIILFSTFDDLDQKGRNVGYMFYYNNADNVYQARTTLENYAIIAGVHPNKKDLDMFEKMLRLNSKHPILANHSGKLSIACVSLLLFALFNSIFGSSEKESTDEQSQKDIIELKNR